MLLHRRSLRLTCQFQFVRTHQVLLNILIGKAGLFDTIPVIGAPVAAVLRQIEAVVDVNLSLHIFSSHINQADYSGRLLLSHLLTRFKAGLVISRIKPVH